MKAAWMLALVALSLSSGAVNAQEGDGDPSAEPGWKLDFGGKGAIAYPVIAERYGGYWGAGAFFRGRLPSVVFDLSLTLYPVDPRHPNRTPEDSAGFDATLSTMFRAARFGGLELFVGGGVGFSVLGVTDLEGEIGEEPPPELDGLFGQHASARAMLQREVGDLLVVFVELELQGYSLGYDEDDEPAPEDDGDASLDPDTELARGVRVMANVGVGFSIGL